MDADAYLFSECGNTKRLPKSSLCSHLPLDSDAGWHSTKDGVELGPSPIMDGIPKQHPVLVNVPNSHGGPILFINSHLSCCGNDEARQDLVDEMMAWIVNNVGDLNVYTPIVYAGDLNLVGYAQQLETLLTGDIVQTQTFGQCQIGMKLLGQMPCPVRLAFTYTWRDDGDGNFPQDD